MFIHCTKLKPGKIELEASFMPKSSPSQGIPLFKVFSISDSSSVKSIGMIIFHHSLLTCTKMGIRIKCRFYE